MAKLKFKFRYLLGLVFPFSSLSSYADEPKAAGSEDEAKKEASGELSAGAIAAAVAAAAAIAAAVDDDDSPDITQTPKFRLLELVRENAGEEGISPENLVAKAESANIPRPRLQMNKMIRRGILYIHEGKVHVT